MQTRPKVGDKIRLTNLPNPRNAPFDKSVYIGAEGEVIESDKDGLYLKCDSYMLVVGKEYRYKLLN